MNAKTYKTSDLSRFGQTRYANAKCDEKQALKTNWKAGSENKRWRWKKKKQKSRFVHPFAYTQLKSIWLIVCHRACACVTLTTQQITNNKQSITHLKEKSERFINDSRYFLFLFIFDLFPLAHVWLNHCIQYVTIIHSYKYPATCKMGNSTRGIYRVDHRMEQYRDRNLRLFKLFWFLINDSRMEFPTRIHTHPKARGIQEDSESCRWIYEKKEQNKSYWRLH